MAKQMRVLILIVMAVVLGALGQTPGRSGKKGDGPPTESKRPAASRQIRTAVTGLLGWEVGVPGNAFPQLTFFEAALKTDALGLAYIEGFSTQKVSPEIPKNLDDNLSPDEVNAVKNKLRALNLHLSAYHVDSVATDRKVFDFAKSLGAGMIISPAAAASLPEIYKLANEAGINVAIENIRDPGALQSCSARIGVSTAIGKTPAQFKDRLMAVHMRGAGLPQALLELSRQLPPPQANPTQCSNCSRKPPELKHLFMTVDAAGIEDFEKAVRPAMGYRVEEITKVLPITSTDRVPADERQKIEAALPREALAKSKKPRKLLVIDLCPAGGYYHATIAHANLALELMAKNTGAYEPVFSNDLNNLKYPKVKQFDAVFLNSVVGDVFPDPDVLNGLLRFVREGGGVAGIHGSTYASMDLPEYGDMMGGQDGPHHVEPATLKIDDPDSPLTRKFGGKDFPYVDEYYHFLPTGPYSRDKLHVLLSIDTAKSDMSQWKVRPDNDYGLVWIKNYGKGRVFNCALGHTPTLFANPALAEMVLGGIQFALGDLQADATPSAKLARK